MNDLSLKSKVFVGLFWKFFEKLSLQIVNFIIQIVLARLLFPEDFGVIALISIFIDICNLFIQSGFSTALIQKKEIDELDLSSVFYLNIFVGLLSYIGLFLSAPIIADFYKQSILIPVLRIQSIILLFGALNIIQYTILEKNMRFKSNFNISIIAIIVQGITGIYLAFSGYGIWSLVFSTIVGSVVTTICLWLLVGWRPKLIFSFKRVYNLFNYSSKLLFTSLLNIFYNNVYSLVIGKVYDSTILGYYNRGQNIPYMVIGTIKNTTSSVMFPAFSACQDDLIKLKNIARNSIQASMFLITPIMIGLLVISESLICLILTDKWLPAVPIMQMCCIRFLFLSMDSINLQVLYAIGRSDVVLKFEVYKKIISLLLLLVSIPFGLSAMMLGSVISAIIVTTINMIPNIKYFNYTFKEQINDIIPSLFLSIFMAIIIYPINFLGISNLTKIIMQIFIGVLIYFMGATIFNMKYFVNFQKYIKKGSSLNKC